MQLLITHKNMHQHLDLMQQVYLFRHRFFVDHMKWEALRKPDGLEIDQFDNADCVHIVGTYEDRIISYSRLLPTTKPHLLSHVYPEMLDGQKENTGPSIWEWTRCAVDPFMREGRKGADIATIGMTLGVIEACLALDISALHIQTHPMLLTRLLELGFKCTPLALPKDYDGKPVVPIYALVDQSTLDTARAMLGINSNLLIIEQGLVPAPSINEQVHNVRIN
jgi:acyl-homoserine lactone synthase